MSMEPLNPLFVRATLMMFARNIALWIVVLAICGFAFIEMATWKGGAWLFLLYILAGVMCIVSMGKLGGAFFTLFNFLGIVLDAKQAENARRKRERP